MKCMDKHEFEQQNVLEPVPQTLLTPSFSLASRS